MSPELEDLKDAYDFFLENSGYATPPGRAVCALDKARAEKRANELGFVFSWEYDDDCPLDRLGDHCYWCEDAKAEREHSHEVEGCSVRDSAGHVLASLWGIIDADRNYRRVIEGELAQEALTEYDKREASRCPTCNQTTI
jgi:hypothetical protein